MQTEVKEQELQLSASDIMQDLHQHRRPNVFKHYQNQQTVQDTLSLLIEKKEIMPFYVFLSPLPLYQKVVSKDQQQRMSQNADRYFLGNMAIVFGCYFGFRAAEHRLLLKNKMLNFTFQAKMNIRRRVAKYLLFPYIISRIIILNFYQPYRQYARETILAENSWEFVASIIDEYRHDMDLFKVDAKHQKPTISISISKT